ncbi:MAG: hypothetical protein OEY51_06445, partial [Cyclobacteriaceae bacterium]|nr:hypothetical protein [Cyclobacteriaceae bacterium]
MFSDVFTAIGTWGGTATNTPRALLNYIIFDDSLGYVSSGFDRIDVSAGFVPYDPLNPTTTGPGTVPFDELTVPVVNITQPG